MRLDDGQKYKVTIVDANGKTRTVDISPDGSMSGNIAAAVGGYTQKEMNDIMVASGLDYNKALGWHAKEERAKYIEQESVSTDVSVPEKKSGISSVLDALKNIKTAAGSAIASAIKAVIINPAEKLEKIISSFASKKTQIEEKETPSANTFTIAKGDKTVELYGVDSNNPVLSQLYRQIDPEFADIPMIKKAGCNFMVALAYAQMITGQVLTAQQIKDIWNEAVQNPKILKFDGEVRDNDKISNMALEKLGRTDIIIAHRDDGKPNDRAELIGYRVTVPCNPFHHTAGDVNKNIVYNHGYTTGKTEKTRGIYVYVK